MQWSEQHKVVLNILFTISALAAIGVVLTFRSNPGLELQPWQLGLAILPWLLLTMSSLSLLYLSWFGRPKPRGLFFKKLVFWLLTAGMLSIFGFLYLTFVFGVRAGQPC